MVEIGTENFNQMSFCPFAPQEISVLFELILGHLSYPLSDVPPQPNSPPDYVFNARRGALRHRLTPENTYGTTARFRVRLNK